MTDRVIDEYPQSLSPETVIRFFCSVAKGIAGAVDSAIGLLESYLEDETLDLDSVRTTLKIAKQENQTMFDILDNLAEYRLQKYDKQE